MVGSFSVGKTSLVSRYVYSIFSDAYLSSIGVKISKKDVASSKGQVKLMVWDLEGRDDYGEINTTYLRGSNGLIIVVDGTREETLSAALGMHQKALNLVGEIPFLLLINKQDLADEWEITPKMLKILNEKNYNPIFTSAKNGLNVEKAFKMITDKMVTPS
jgi:small GTP-binding protein